MKVWLHDVQLEGEPLWCAEEVALALAQQLARYGTLAVEGVICEEPDDLGGYCRFDAQVQVAGKQEVNVVVGCEGALDLDEGEEWDEGYSCHSDDTLDSDGEGYHHCHHPRCSRCSCWAD
jgi:hypothetical protein